MTPLTLEVTARTHAVAVKAVQPGTEEAAAAREILGLPTSENATPADLLTAPTDKIAEKAAVSGYRRAAQNQTSEDRAFARAARRRSARVVQSQLNELP